MQPLLRKFRATTGSSGGGLALLLAFVVVLPSACLIWFMKEATQNERLALRQKLAEAYRGHLSLAAERLNAHWQRVVATSNRTDQPGPALFAKYVKEGLADAVICFDADGRLRYPQDEPPGGAPVVPPAWHEAEALELAHPARAAELFGRLASQGTNSDLAARALQAQARCLLRAGDKVGALKITSESLVEDRFEKAIDIQGRCIVPNAELMALEIRRQLGSDLDPALLTQLQRRLNDYTYSMPSGQRRFLMHEVQKLQPGIAFPTLAAEDLANQYLGISPAEISTNELRAAGLPGVWHVTTPDRRIIALHRTEQVLARMHSVIASDTLPNDAAVQLLAPGVRNEKALFSVPAGPALQGWTLALSVRERNAFETNLISRGGPYIMIGIAAILVMVVLGLLALGLLRRQVALNRLRNDLVANVTHELKTPLSSMRLLVDTLLNSDVPQNTAREYLQLIARENMRLSRLIDNFLTFSRIERNKLVFSFREISPNSIAEDAAAAVRERFQGPACRFDTRLSPDLPAINADPEAMVTVLVNLLDNAWKYSGEEKRILLRSSAHNGHVLFSVEDNGVGLAERDQERIFQRFYQVKRSPHPAGGCGLGLSIVKFIVAAHDGQVEVESAPQKGSTFTVILPALNALPVPKEKSA